MSFAASAREGERLIDEDGVAAVIGTHPSGVREILGPKIGRRVPYVYTPIFEGDGYEPGVFYLGETAYQQLGPVLPWMKSELGTRRWHLIGNDFRWPRDVHRIARRLLGEQEGEIVGDRLVPLETEDFDAIVSEIRSLRPDALIVTLVGSDAVIFHRAFTRAGLGQSCYEGLMFLHRIVSAAGSLDVKKLGRVADGLEMTGPRGRMRMVGRHFVKDIHLAEADGVEFAIRQTFPQVEPNRGNPT